MSSEVYAESIETPAVKKTPAQSKPETGESGPSALVIIAILVLIIIAIVLISKNVRKSNEDKKNSGSATDIPTQAPQQPQQNARSALNFGQAGPPIKYNRDINIYASDRRVIPQE